jgi:HEAT repeat protein
VAEQAYPEGGVAETSQDADALVRMLLANDDAARAPFAERLVGDLHDPDPVVRWRAALALGSLGRDDPAVVAPLVAALSDPSAAVRSHASRALVRLGTVSLGPLVAALADPDAAAAALVTLAAIGAPAIAQLLEALSAGDGRLRWTAAAALEDIGGAQAVGALVGLLRDPGADADARECAITALGHIGTPAVAALGEAIGAADARIREDAAAALGLTGDVRAFMPLIVALDDGVATVRGAAAWSLGGLRDARAFMPLLVALDDADPSARAGAAAGLGRFADPRATGPLISALEDDDERVRARVVSALGEIGDRKTVQFLMATLMFDPSEAVRHNAADALGEMGAVAVPPLLEALDGETEEARSWIVAALESIGAPAIESTLGDLADGEDAERIRVSGALDWLYGDRDADRDAVQLPGPAPARG